MRICLGLLVVNIVLSVPVTQEEEGRLDFLYRHLGAFNKVYPISTDDGVVLVAVSQIEQGEAIAGVSLENSYTSFDTFPLSPYLETASHTIKLAAQILYDRLEGKPTSLRQQYIRSLSHQIPNAFNWTKSNQEELNRFNVLEFQYEGARAERMDYEQYVGFLQNAKVPDGMLEYNNWLWAYGHLYKSGNMISKRVWLEGRNRRGSQKDEEELGHIFYPFLDLAQHCPGRPTDESPIALTDQNGVKAVILLAERNFKPGQVICYQHIETNNYALAYVEGKIWERNPDTNYLYKIPNDGELSCPGESDETHCFFEIVPDQLNTSLLRFLMREIIGNEAAPIRSIRNYWIRLTEDPQPLIESLLAYRIEFTEHILQEKINSSLRLLRREASTETNWQRKQILKFAASNHMLVHNQLKLVERDIIYVLLTGLTGEKDKLREEYEEEARKRIEELQQIKEAENQNKEAESELKEGDTQLGEELGAQL